MCERGSAKPDHKVLAGTRNYASPFIFQGGWRIVKGIVIALWQVS